MINIEFFRSLRKTIYNVLIDLLKASPNNYFMCKNMENFMKESFFDITPIQSEVTLTLPGKGKNKNKNKGGEIKKTVATGVVDTCLKLHQMICEKSLDFLINLLMFNGAIMKPVLFKILQDKIIFTSLKLLSKDLCESDLYDSDACRLKILNMCNNIIIHPSSRNVTPMSFAMEILMKFKNNDRNPSIRQRAAELVRNLEAVMHSRKDPIHFPADLRDFRDTWLFNEKIVKSFAQLDNEKYQQYEDAYHEKQLDSVITIDDADENLIESVNENKSIVVEIPDDIDDNNTNENEKNSNDDLIKISSTTDEDDDDVEEIPLTVPETKTISNKRTTRSNANKSEETPAKIAKTSIITEDLSEKNSGDTVESYLKDFVF